MSAGALLAANSKPGDADIDRAMSGNICRCGTSADIKKAIKQVAMQLESSVQHHTPRQCRGAGHMNQYLRSRRSFLKLLGVSGGGLVIGVPEAVDGVFQSSAWLQITATNKIHFYQPYNEMGQGTATGVTTLLAEE